MFQRITRFFSEEISSYIRAQDKKPYFQQYKEMYALWSYYQCLPYQYIQYGVYRTSCKGRALDYIPTRLIGRYRRHINPVNSRDHADNKFIFNQLMTTAGITVVPIYFVIDRLSGISYPDENTTIQFDPFVKSLAQHNKYFFVKPNKGICGDGILRFEVKDGALFIENKIYDEAAFFGTLILRPS